MRVTNEAVTSAKQRPVKSSTAPCKPARAKAAKIQAILFDMDGVLVDAKDWHYLALNQALGLFGMEISRDEHLAIYDGLPTRTKLDMLSRSRGLPKALHSFINEIKQSATIQLTFERCRPVFHHQYALARLRQEGYKLAVCSNSIRPTVEVMMEKSSLAMYLDLMLSNEDVDRPKPHPDIYQKAMEKLGLTPKECLIVEDNDHGIEAARASGGHVVVVGTTNDVTYDRILRELQQAEQRP